MWHDLETSTVGDLPSATLATLVEALAKVESNLAAAVARSRSHLTFCGGRRSSSSVH